jgi:hypothetical protein
MLAEIERREIPERGVDEHVAVRERLALLGGVVADQDGQHLVGHGRHGVELAALEQWEPAVHHDENVDAHLSRHVDGQIR